MKPSTNWPLHPEVTVNGPHVTGPPAALEALVSPFALTTMVQEVGFPDLVLTAKFQVHFVSAWSQVRFMFSIVQSGVSAIMETSVVAGAADAAVAARRAAKTVLVICILSSCE